jgi:CRISPR system Cascade subunit CasA
MNLVSDPWIPVIGADGKPRLASLATIFKEGDDIADLAANPCRRIALMRLLICIAQAALDGPEDEADWRACRPRIAPAALDYLAKWQDRFNLFGEHAFLQVDGLEIPDDSFIKTPNTLEATSAKGGTGVSMLWDHSADVLTFRPTDTRLALNLLCYMNFSCSGKIGKAQWGSFLFNGSTAAGPSHKFLHSYVLGKNILDSVHYNLTPRDVVVTSVVMGDATKWGRPVWENMPQTPHTEDALRNASESYLGRLVPLSRLVKFFIKEGAVICTIGPPPDALRMQRMPFLREPAASVISRGEDGDAAYLQAKAGRHVWRDLESIMATDRQCGTLSLQPFMDYYVYPQRRERFRLWIGGAAKGDNEGKYDDLAEWSADLYSACFVDRSLAAYRNGILVAENGKGTLFKAMRKFAKPNKDIPGMDAKLLPLATAEGFFWNELDRNFEVLLSAVSSNTEDDNAAWKRCIADAMLAAYSQCCPHETPRQIQAYAQGLKALEAWKGALPND